MHECISPADDKLNQTAFDRERRTLEEISSHRKLFTHPPPEILHLIFQRALPPSFLVDSSISPGPESPWCQAMRLKKSLVRVCRAWHKVGLQVLYEDIVFRRIGQIPVFLQTLETSPDNLGDFVKRITIDSYTPRGYDAMFSSQLARILSMCPRLFRFSFTAPFTLAQPEVLPPLKWSITHLNFGAATQFPMLFDALTHMCSGLVSLSLHIPTVGLGDMDLFIHFDRLEELRCGVTEYSTSNLLVFGAKWSIPRLQRLTFDMNGNPSGTRTALPMVAYESFCKTHGAGLKFLQIHPSYWWSMKYTISVFAILEFCPKLEHLVLHPNTLPPLSHQTVKWIDVWSPHVRQSRSRRWIRDGTLSRNTFPALKTVRILDAALAVLPDLPILIPPNLVTADDEAFEFQFSGVHIRHTRGHLYRDDLRYIVNCNGMDGADSIDHENPNENETADENDEEDDSSDYLSPVTDEDVSDQDLSDDSDASRATATDGGLEDEFYAADDWTMGADAAREIYLETSEIHDI